MTILHRSLLAAFILSICPTVFACDFPDSVSIPDGASASERDMVATDLAIKRYMSELQAFVECVEAETRALRGNAPRRDKAATKLREEKAIRQLNAAAAAMEHAVKQFNEAIAAYKERR